MRSKTTLGGMVLALAAVFCPAIEAAPITYSLIGMASGSIGGVNFSNASFSVVGVGDTDSRTPIDPGVYIVALQSLAVSVDGVGTGLAVDAFSFFVNQTFTEVGFIDNLFGDALDASASFFATYDGISNFASQPVAFDYAAPFTTTGGVFSIDIANDMRFSAVVDNPPSTVPEAPTLMLAAIGLLAALGTRSNRLVQRPLRPHQWFAHEG